MKFTFRARLFAGFALVIAVFLGVIGINVTKIQHALEDVRSLKAETDQMNLAAEWLGNIRQNSARSIAVTHSPGKDLLVFFKAQMDVTRASTTAAQKSFLDGATRPEAKALAEKLSEARAPWLAAYDDINKLKDAGDDAAAAQAVTAKLIPLTDKYIAAAQVLVNGQLAEVERLKNEVELAFADLYKWLLALTLVAIVVAVVVSWRFGRSLVGALTEARASAERIGNGDLAATIHSHNHDEVGQLMQALEHARASLEKVILQARQASDNIQVAATEVATGNQDLAARTEAAASNLEQTASSMEEITATVRQSADAASQANQLAATATEVAQRGGAVVSQVVTTMDDINHSSRKIADIIGVIDSIAFQTNILALNAAVEADG